MKFASTLTFFAAFFGILPSIAHAATEADETNGAGIVNTGFSYQGCVAEGTTGSRRALTAASYSQPNMAVSICQSLCSAYQFAGVEYGTECYCGNSLTNNGGTGSVIPESNCHYSCAGNSSEKCGGDWALSVYSKPPPAVVPAPTPTSAPASAPASTGFSYLGCVAEGTTGSRRALTAASYSRPNMTAPACQSLCSAYQFAGVEYTTECYCGNSLTNNGGTGSVIPESNCHYSCGGNSSEKCGGDWALSVYSKPAPALVPTPTPSTPAPAPTSTSFSYLGCVAEGTIGTRRALTGASFSQSNMTPLVCQSQCSGFQFAGLEIGVQCFCGNSLTNNGASGVLITESDCQTACGGDPSKKCGGPWSLSVYAK